MSNNNENDKYQGREKSGHATASKGTSAASVAKLLKGIDFPAKKND
jgi:hypothetical protein